MEQNRGNSSAISREVLIYEAVRWRMDSLSDASTEIEGLLEVNRDFYASRMAEKTSPTLPLNQSGIPMIIMTQSDKKDVVPTRGY